MMVDRAEPGVLFVGRYRIPEGSFETWHETVEEMRAFVEANLPDVSLFTAFLSADRTEGTSIHAHRDAASFDGYLAAMAGRISTGSSIVAVQSIDLYGTPTDDTVAHLRAMGDWPVRVHAPALGPPPTDRS